MATKSELKRKIASLKRQEQKIAMKRVKDVTSREKRIYPGLGKKRRKLEDQLYG